jgi:pyruvate,water dikinase
VAEALGFPQDLEWAVEDGRVRLLQSRPITTVAAVFHNRALEPWAGKGDPDSPDRVWARAFADEIWTPPVSPLFYDLQNLTRLVSENLTRNFDPDPIAPDVFKYYRAAAYIDADLLQRMYAALPPIARRPGLVELLPRHLQTALRKTPWRWRRAARRAWLFEVTKGAHWGLTRNHRLLARSWDGFLARTQPLMDADLARLDDGVLDAHLAEVLAAAGSIGPECQVAVVYHAQELKLLLSGLLERWFGDGERLYAEVSSGLEDSHTVREAQALWTLAREVVVAGAAGKLASLPWRRARAAALRLGLTGFVQGFEAFLAAHRHRGGNYKDVIHPRWGDDPEFLWAQVKSLMHADAASPAAANAASGARRRQAQAELLARPQGATRRAILRRLLALNETYASLRDNHRFYYDRVWWLLRQAFLEKGRRAWKAGRLTAPQDVFHLCRAEIAALAAGALDPAVAAERVRIRRQEWEETRRTLPPKYLAAGYAPVEDAPAETGDLLAGIGASPGEVVGPARVLQDISGLAEVKAGDVLVTRQTDPSWSPAFARLGGLVLETGGVLAHGASLCREFGLPCVTAAEAATTRIADGDILRVSGSRGVVEVVRRAGAHSHEPQSSHGLRASR